MATPTLISPGNAVVPLSSIIDQLKDKLSRSEIDALLEAVLSRRIREVRPGDLITAEMMNQVFTDLADLQTRVATLEGRTGGPVLTNRSPLGDIRVNSLLTLFATGLDSTLSGNTVAIDGVPITSFVAGSDASRLIVLVPDLFAGLPRLVDVVIKVGARVSNPLQMRLLPRLEAQGGQIVVFPQTPPLGTITIGTTYTLQWLVDSQTAQPARYRFRLVFSDVNGASINAWNAASALSPAGEHDISRGSPLRMSATVTVPAAAVRAQVALEVESTDGLFRRTSDPIAFVIGAAPEVSDTRAQLTLPATLGPFDPNGNPNPLRVARISIGGVQLDGLQLQFTRTGEFQIKLGVTSQAGAAGDYVYSATIDNAGAAWTVSSLTPTKHDGLPAGTERMITVKFSNTDATRSPAPTYMIVRAEHRPAGSSTTDFVSFTRFPIQGFTASA